MTAARWRMAASRLGRATYRALPLPERAKAPVKNVIYVLFRPLFADTPAYRAWLQTRRGTFPPVVAQVGWEAYLDGPLPAADGVWEWAPYEPLKAHLGTMLRTRDRSRPAVARTLIELDADDLAGAARSIALPTPPRRPEVSVIVPIHGQLKFTLECLASIAAAGAELSFEVIVADDASPDDSAPVLATVANVRVVTQPENVGFLRNCNRAAREARGKRLVFLNNDTQVQPGWLDALAGVFATEDNVGCVGPRIVYPSGVLQDAGSRVRRDASVEMIGLNGSPDDARWSYRRAVDYISGACLMIDAALFTELGGFDEALAPAYCEDMELGLRLSERGLRAIYEPAAEIVHHLSVTANAAPGDYKVQQITRNMQLVAERHQARLDALDDIRFVAFYLPQFHPFAQNDLWWGTGFTEWTNVSRGRPNWEGHYQPRLPADLGFYDLRLADTLHAQWALAERYGIDALCYYYYWFGGTRLLDRPLAPLLDAKRRAHPFLLCWANENWTRRWDGQANDVLMAQQHSPEDDLAVIRDMLRYIANPAYVRVGGKPLLLVYRVDELPDFRATAERWRAECRAQGIGEIELAMVESFHFAGAPVDPATYGCDAAVEFPAHHIPDTKNPAGRLLNPAFAGAVADYQQTAVYKATRSHPGFRLYRSAMPGWDNTARRQDNPFVLENSTPGAFQAWLEAAIAETKRDLQGDSRLVFINAWNEWAEGAYLEPDRRFGHTYLEAVRNARDASRLETATWD